MRATTHSVTLAAETLRAKHNGEPLSDLPETKRHRRSRHSDHDRYHFVYTLHSPIVPQVARATFRDGIVELHLPKANSDLFSVSVPVTIFANSAHAAQAAVHTRGGATAPGREGSPKQKMGAAYSICPSEDHAAKAQSIGERIMPGHSGPRRDQNRSGTLIPSSNPAA